MIGTFSGNLDGQNGCRPATANGTTDAPHGSAEKRTEPAESSPEQNSPKTAPGDRSWLF